MKKERLEQLKEIKKNSKDKLKNKKFHKLSQKEKDELLETIAKMLGLLKD